MRLDNSEKLAVFAKALRDRIAGKADEESIPQYRALWALEFKAPIPEHPKLRSRIEEDLKFLESLDRDRHKSLTYILQEGYKLTGNKAAQEKLTAEAKTPNETIQAFFQAQQEWSKANPYPTPADPPERRDAHFRQRVQMLDEWVGKLPEELIVRLDRLRSLSEIADTADDVLRQEGEAALAASRKQTGTVMMSPAAPMQVAEIWAKRGMELERVPELVREGREAYARQRERQGGMERSDLFGGPERQLMEENNRWYGDVTAWRTLVLAYSKTGKIAEARDVIAQWDIALQQRRKRAEEIRKKRGPAKSEPAAQAAAAAGGPPDRVRMMEDQVLRSVPYAESQYQEALAQVALAEQRKLDALAFYQAALRAAAAGPMPFEPAKSETGRKAAGLWKELGGTNEGWQSWLESLKPSTEPLPGMGSSRWTALSRPVPEFSLLDQAGQTWTVAKLRGKTTLLNVWATWCGPCRVELPHLQKLHDKLKDREDVQVITLNVDDNTGLIEPFLKENNYSFPVLLAKSFIDAFTGPIGIPTNWISDRAGSLRLESLGFSGDGEEWLKQTLEQMEKVRESGAPANQVIRPPTGRP
jgi:thiol-disulfide isomerase/thioredoxin